MVVGAGAPGLSVWFGLGGLLCGGGGATAGSARTRSRDQSLENPIGCRVGFAGLTRKIKRYKLCAGEIYA